MDRIRPVHGLPGQTKIRADLAGRVRQQKSAADIRKEAEPDFGHSELCLFRHHTVAAVRRQADAATHHDAVHEGDIGFWELLDAGVEDVFLPPQDFSEIALDLRALPKRADVAAGAQPALARAFEQDHRDLGIGIECIQRLDDVAKHLQRHGIDRLRPVEADDAGGALALRDQVGLGGAG